MINEGVIKFNCKWFKSSLIDLEPVKEVIECRKILYDFKLIGKYESGIGYGNISIRINKNSTVKPQFIITGTQTSVKQDIEVEDFSIVSDFDIEKNYIECYGLSKASSESLTHAILYSLDDKINSVIHVHSPLLWNKLIDKVPTTDISIDYGTTQMAYEIRSLHDKNKLQNSNIIVMGGHKHGIIVFGENVRTATETIVREFYISGFM